jgi:peptide subunit release factor 1 (eRF1)
VLGDYRAGGLATAGAEETYEALANGQVDELLLAAPPPSADGASTIADDLVTKARQTSARVRFIEDSTLLADVGGVAASLRYRLQVAASERRERVRGKEIARTNE